MLILFRERSVSPPSAIHAIARTPSHLISNSQLGSENGCSTSVASIGSARDGIALLRAPCTSAARIGTGSRLVAPAPQSLRGFALLTPSHHARQYSTSDLPSHLC